MIKTLCLVIAFGATPFIAQAGVFKNLEHGAEIEILDLSRADSGLIYARLCDYCEVLALSLGPQTQFFLGTKPLSSSDVARLRNRGATVFFDAETKKITRVVYWEEQ